MQIGYRYIVVGDDYGEGPPVPIPNTEVKLTCADNTLRVTAREDRFRQHHERHATGMSLLLLFCFYLCPSLRTEILCLHRKTGFANTESSDRKVGAFFCLKQPAGLFFIRQDNTSPTRAGGFANTKSSDRKVGAFFALKAISGCS